jgi:hypothetical protein
MMNSFNTKKVLISGLTLGLMLFLSRVFTGYYIINIVDDVFLMTIGSFAFTLIIPFVILLVLVNDLRKEGGGYWTFKNSVKNIFCLLIVAYFSCYIAMNLIYVKMIDRDIEQNIGNSLVKATSDYLDKTSIDLHIQKIKIQEMQKQFDDLRHSSIKDSFLNIGKYFLYIIGTSIVLGWIYQRKPFLNDDLELLDFQE